MIKANDVYHFHLEEEGAEASGPNLWGDTANDAKQVQASEVSPENNASNKINLWTNEKPDFE